jgi:hypothetical protein
VNQQQAEQRHSDGRAEFRRRIENRRGEAPFARWKPVADGFGIAREGGSFANSKQQTRGEKTSHAGGGRCAEGRDAPEQGADSADELYAEAVE